MIPIRLQHMLVAIICVGTYLHNNVNDLPGTQTDKTRLISLFEDKYNYKVYSNPRADITWNEME